MNDYKLENLIAVINKLRHLVDEKKTWLVGYLRLQALFVYFQYAVASVRIQEENIRKMEGGQHKNFETHIEYEDCLLKIYSSAITTYSNLRTCLGFTQAIINSISDKEQDKDFRKFRDNNKAWVKEVVDKRDRIAAHPEEEDRIVWKPNAWSDNGQVRFRVINPENPESSRQITLEPRNDLEKLRKYLLELTSYLERLWSL